VHRLVVACALVIAVVLVATLWHGQGHGIPTTTTARSSVANPAPRVPVLKEDFTVLACSNSTTLGLEGCAEHRILKLDAQIMHQRRSIFPLLRDVGARRRFVRAESAWFNYRQAYCASAADVNNGGTLAPVDFADCVAGLDARHVVDLATLRTSYESH
jgi:uncharacterized protein YecT (DUF1311 family)